MPTLRKVLIQILTELEYSGIGRNKEQSAKLLGHLISNAPKLTRPYHEPILKVPISSVLYGTGLCGVPVCVWGKGGGGGGEASGE